MTIPSYCIVGEFTHGIAVTLEVEEVCGNWERILSLSERTNAAVMDNLSTPCIRNARSLLVTALAAAHHGDAQAAGSFEQLGEEVATQGYDFILAAPRAQLALQRGDIDAALALTRPFDEFAGVVQTWFALQMATARLDALVASGDRASVELEAARLMGKDTYLEPFVLRAIGIVQEDDQLIADALERFDAMQLDWHANQARALL